MRDGLTELGPATSLVLDVLVNEWGGEVVVSCLYDPAGSRRPYQLLFSACRRVQWDIIDPGTIHDPEADLIGLDLEIDRGSFFPQVTNDERTVAVVHTDIFELIVLHGGFAVQKDW